MVLRNRPGSGVSITRQRSKRGPAPRLQPRGGPPSRCVIVWGIPIQNFSRIVVHPVLDGSYPLFTDPGKVGTFGKESPDHAVLILTRSLLPGRVTVTVPHIKSDPTVNGFPQLFHLQELCSVVCGDALKSLPEIRVPAFQGIKYAADRGCFPVRQLEDHFISADSLCEC